MIWSAPTGAAICSLLLVACTGHRQSPSMPQGRELFPHRKTPVAVMQLVDRIAQLHGAPRPTVVLGDAVVAPRTGFRTGEQKQAFLSGRFRLAGQVRTRGAPAGGAESFSSALELIRTPEVTCCFQSSVPPLTIGSATLTTASFITDRGDTALPAWAIHLAAVPDPAYVLAAPPTTTVVVPPSDAAEVHSNLAADQRHLTVHFVGAPAGNGPCEGNYAGAAVEAPAIVTIHITEHSGKTPNGVGCAVVGTDRQLTLVLRRPLGPRVVVAGGGIVEVDPSAP